MPTCPQPASTAPMADLHRLERAWSPSCTPAVSLQLDGRTPRLRLAADEAGRQHGRRTQSGCAPLLDATVHAGAHALGKIVGDHLLGGRDGPECEIHASL